MIRAIGELRSKFETTWLNLDLQGNPRPFFDTLVLQYSQPHRRYHGLDHLLDGIDSMKWFMRRQGYTDYDLSLVCLAFFYHDYVWDSQTPDDQNVEASAVVAGKVAEENGLPLPETGVLRQLVRATNHKSPPAPLVDRLIVCMDLAILGQPWDIYRWYAHFVREEYPQYTDQEWREGRSAFWDRWDLGQIYPLPEFKQRCGSQAEANIKSEQALLRSGKLL